MNARKNMVLKNGFCAGRELAINSLSHAGTFWVMICRLFVSFRINVFENFFQEYYLGDRQFGFRSDLTFVSGLICIQTVCKDKLQTTLADKELMKKNRRNNSTNFGTFNEILKQL